MMLPVTYGYARVSKADDDSKNLDTQILELQRHGIREGRTWSSPTSLVGVPSSARAGRT